MKPTLQDETRSSDICSRALDEETNACARLGVDPLHFERSLFAGARNFLLRPGKGFRAQLVETSFRLSGGDAKMLPRAALEAIELLHAGSLIIDDIQDDAESRRGGRALHRMVGMPQALNAGNWLYFVALSKLDELRLGPEQAHEVSRMAHRCLLRCHEGQALDLGLRVNELKRAEVYDIAQTTSLLKTGALMSFSAHLGGLLAGALARELYGLARFGGQAGLALQMLDDLGSFVAPDRHNKGLEDLRNQRVSWVWAWATEVFDEITYKQFTRQTARGEQLEDLVRKLGGAVEDLARRRIARALCDAVDGLSQVFGQTPVIEEVRAGLATLEASYG